MPAQNLHALEQIARLKAERELNRFAAFSCHVVKMRQDIDRAHDTLRQCYESTSPLSIVDARMANAQAGRSARILRHAQAELDRVLPKFELARQSAARDFGRAEALRELAIAQAPKRGG